MKKRFVYNPAILVILFIITSIVSKTPHAAKQELLPNGAPRSIQISTGNWCPYHGTCNDGKDGFVIDTLREIFTQAGIQAEFYPIPSNRAFANTREGKYYGILSIGPESAPDFFFGDEELGVYQYCYLTKAEDTWRYSGVQSLIGRKTAVLKDGSMAEDHSFIQDPKNQEYFSHIPYTKTYMDQVIEMLKSDRIDTFVNERNVVAAYLHQHPELKEKIKIAGCISVHPLYCGFTPKPELRSQVVALSRIVDEGMRRMRESGRLEEIMKSYGLEIWEKWQNTEK